MSANDINNHPKALRLREQAAKAFAEPSGEEQTKQPIETALNIAFAKAASETAVKEALRKERNAIAYMLDEEASHHESAAAEAREETGDSSEDAWMHGVEAATLRTLAEAVRARTPAEPKPEAPEIVF